MTQLVLARFDPLSPSYLLSIVIVLFAPPSRATVPFSGNYSLSIYPLNSYRFFVGGSQCIEHSNLFKPYFSIAVLRGTKHYLFFRALSPSKLLVCTKHSPFSSELIKNTISAGRCSPSCKKIISPHFTSFHLHLVKFDFKTSASSLCDWRDLKDSLPSGEFPPLALTEQSKNFSGFLRIRHGILLVNRSLRLLFCYKD